GRNKTFRCGRASARATASAVGNHARMRTDGVEAGTRFRTAFASLQPNNHQEVTSMKRMQLFSTVVAGVLISLPALGAQPPAPPAPVAGSTLLGVTVVESRQLAEGWSTTRQILGQSVYNEQGEKVGTIDDVIISPDKTASYAILGVGGFL